MASSLERIKKEQEYVPTFPVDCELIYDNVTISVKLPSNEASVQLISL